MMANEFNLSNIGEGGMLAALMAAQLGSEVSKGQGVGGVVGGTVSDMIKAHNFMNLIKTMGGTGAVGGAQTPGAAGVGTGASSADTGAGTGAGTGVEKSEITIKGNKLSDVTKALSGLGNIEPTPEGINQMLSPQGVSPLRPPAASQGIPGLGATSGLDPVTGMPNFLMARS